MEFTPITTQEQLDGIISERLKRDREAQSKKYEGWISPEDAQKQTGELQKQIETLSKENEGHKATIAKHEASIKKYETASVKSRIADEVGLDRRLINRLNGETEDEIRADAKGLKELFGSANVPDVDMMRSTEPSQKGGNTNAAWAEMSAQLRD
jgi:CRISPR/Cas system CSM-associated protein Csm4 (group 5 of RAMP superfamily)